MKEYENSLQESDGMNKYPKDSQRQNFYPYDNNQNYPNDNLANHMNNNQNDNLINNEDNMEININKYQYANDLNNKEENSLNMSQEEIKLKEEINYKIFRGFLVKVYGIISFQLLITLIIVLLFQKESINNYFIKRPRFTDFLNILSSIGFIGTIILLSFKKDLSKQVPYNYISLFIMTIFLSLMCGFTSLNYTKDSVIFCIVLTLLSSISISVYAYYTKINWGLVLALIIVAISQCFGFLLMLFILRNSLIEKVLCFFGTLLFGVYLVHDTQIIMNKFGETYGVDDYIFAAINLYLDIINLFLAILSFFGKKK